MHRLLFIVCFVFSVSSLTAQNTVPHPNPQQAAWQDMEYYFFAHFGPNTFTGLEWGKGDENTEVFNPVDLDCEQWVRIAKEAGAKGIIITAKHHDGFCLWPSKYSTHTVRESAWKNGKGDVLRELSDACKKYGIKFGVYLSPWDRNHPAYGTPEYNDVFINMTKEIFENYGPIWELWWDGANGEGPNGKKQVYDFPRFEKVVREISPNTIIFSDIGPDARWVGNEKGIAGKTNWNTLDTAGFKRGVGAPSTDTLNVGNVNGKHWIPAEVDVSIRPGWFYHKDEDKKVRTPDNLFQLYLTSVGRGANLLLNIPPNPRGLFSPEDSAALVGFKELREKSFQTNLSDGRFAFVNLNGKKKKINKNWQHQLSQGEISLAVNEPLAIEFKQPQEVNCIVLEEYLMNGQNCIRFRLKIKDEKGQAIKTLNETTIGHKRILTFPSVAAKSLELIIEDQKAPTSIRAFNSYLIPEQLAVKGN